MRQSEVLEALILSHIEDDDVDSEDTARNIISIIETEVRARVLAVLTAAYSLMNDEQITKLVSSVNQANEIIKQGGA